VKQWYVYMLRCAKGALYTGITNNLPARLKTHNSGKGSKAIRALGLPASLVWVESVADKSAALRRECALKRLSKSQKESMVQSFRGSLIPAASDPKGQCEATLRMQ
jgi:putative endonuclease